MWRRERKSVADEVEFCRIDINRILRYCHLGLPVVAVGKKTCGSGQKVGARTNHHYDLSPENACEWWLTVRHIQGDATILSRLHHRFNMRDLHRGRLPS